MGNVLKGFILLVVIVVLGGCSASVNKETTVKPEDKGRQSVELKGQSLTDIRKLVTPDQLVYLHDGVETVYKSNNKRFERIIQLNNARQTETLGALKLVIDDKEVARQGDYLIYKYTKTHYAPVYFKLVPSPDERLENWVVNNYGSNNIPSDEKDDPSKVETYGHLAPADELLEYLNIKY